MPDLARRLGEAGLAGIKDSTRSMERHREYLNVAANIGRPFEVYMGTDGLALEALQSGSAGIVSAIANLNPELFVALRDAARSGRSRDATYNQEEILKLRTSLQQGDLIANLKQGVRQRMEQVKVAYPTALRLPLGATAS